MLVHRGRGEAFGPGDVLTPYPSWGFMIAAEAVERMEARKKLTEEERAFVVKFVGK